MNRQGKSWVIALYAIVRCILYPGTKIAIASGTRGQAANIISGKIVDFYRENPAIRYEIGSEKNIVPKGQNPQVTFKNNSTITAITSGESARGVRANILIVDEFRLVKKDNLEKILKPVANVNRQPRFRSNPKYANYPQEENKLLLISSAWYKSHWIWDEFQSYVKNMLKDTDKSNYFVTALPYQLSVYHGILSKRKVATERASDTFDQTTWDMENEAIFVGQNDSSYFKLDSLNKIRNLKKVFIPPTNEEYIENKALSKPKKLGNMPKRKEIQETRIISLDIALMGGNKNVKNDTSAFTLIRLINDGDEYKREVVGLKSITGSISSQDLAIELKRLYRDFEADYVVMDANGNGIGVFDACASVLHDEERDEDYEPWASMNDEATNERVKTDGLPVVYTVKATADFNHIIATGLKSAITSEKLQLPINHIEKRNDFINQNGGKFLNLTPEEQQRQLYSYQQASALVNELINLEYQVRDGGKIRIYEVGTTTKDRYSSLAYGNFYADELERQLKNKNKSRNMLDYLMI